MWNCRGCRTTYSGEEVQRTFWCGRGAIPWCRFVFLLLHLWTCVAHGKLARASHVTSTFLSFLCLLCWMVQEFIHEQARNHSMKSNGVWNSWEMLFAESVCVLPLPSGASRHTLRDSLQIVSVILNFNWELSFTCCWCKFGVSFCVMFTTSSNPGT